jgi:acetyl-CoA acetyltransferase family protein
MGEKRVAIIGGRRTPFVKAGTAFRDLSQLDLSAHAVRGIMEAFAIDPNKVDQLVWGRVLHDPRISNLAREIVFRLGLPATIRAWLVSNNCISSIHAVTDVADAVRLGRIGIGIAGGVEAMSDAPVLFGRAASKVFLAAALAKTPRDKLKVLARLRPKHFRPEPLAFREPSTGLSMGEHAEITAKKWGITREEQDEIALRSHVRAAAATADGRLKAEISPLGGLDRDPIFRTDTSREKLAALKPVFDRSAQGTVTAGNSSPLTDGAAAVLLMSEEAARREGFLPIAFIRDFEYAAIHPGDGLLLAPAVAVPRLLRRNGLRLADMEIVEMHEAFAAQVAFTLAAWRKGWKEEAIGEVAPERLNPAGSSIALGHPFGATGARIVTRLANEMERRSARYGLVSICAAGGMGVGMILERA